MQFEFVCALLFEGEKVLLMMMFKKSTVDDDVQNFAFVEPALIPLIFITFK